MILFDEIKLSEWAYWKCDQEKKFDFKFLITNSFYAYCYCKNIENDPEIREYITEPWDLFHYINDIDETDQEIIRKYKETTGVYQVFI